MQTNRIILLFIIMLLGAVSLRAQGFVRDVSNNGTVAAAFLEIGIGARAEAMGGAYTAQSAKTEMVYWNPSGLAFLEKSSFTFSSVKWLADTQMDFGAASFPLKQGKSVVSVAFTTLGVPEQKVRTVESPEGTGEMYDARDFAFSLSYASRLLDSFSYGITAKYINQRIYAASASQFAFDAGVQLKTPLRGLTMGASISNFGDDMQMGGRVLDDIKDPSEENSGVDNIPVSYKTKKEALPQIFRFGLAYEKDLGDFELNTAVDLLHPRAATESINLGGELGYKKLIYIRGGYQNLFERYSINGLTLGMGLAYTLPNRNRFTIDYAWADWGILKQSHKVSVSIYL